MMVQYGPPIEHQNEEARSRFLSPVSASHFSDHRPPANSNFYPEIFNRLIAVFGFAFRNLPESTIRGRIATKGRVEYYFQTMGSIPVFLYRNNVQNWQWQRKLGCDCTSNSRVRWSGVLLVLKFELRLIIFGYHSL